MYLSLYFVKHSKIMYYFQEMLYLHFLLSWVFLMSDCTRKLIPFSLPVSDRRWIIFPLVNCVACSVVHHAQGKLPPSWHSYLLIPHTHWCVMRVVVAGLYISQSERTGNTLLEKRMPLSASWLEQVKATGLPACLCAAPLTPSTLCSSHMEMLLTWVRWAAFI